MSELSVSIVVVNFNGLAHLRAFFASLGAQDFPASRVEVIVVDNGSRDGSVAYLKAAHPQVVVLENATNRGFAPAVNQGAAVARGRYLAFLNNDMRLAPDWLSRMVDHLDDAPADVVCVGSRILDWDGERVDFVGGEMGFHGLATQTSFRAPADSVAAAYPTELLFACGGAMLIDREVFHHVGGFDDDYFAYFEDVDLGWRLWVMGYRVAFCPGAIAYHRFHGTAGRFASHKRTLLYERNALYSIIKNYDDDALAAALPAALMLQTKRAALRARLDRRRYRMAAGSDDRLKRKSWKVLAKLFLRARRELGWRSALSSAFVYGRNALLQRLLGPGTLVVTRESLAGLAAVEDVIDALPRLYAKRGLVQAARRRSDQEIYPLFKAPFDVGMSHPELAEAQASLLEALNLTGTFHVSREPASEAEATDWNLVSADGPRMTVIVTIDAAHPHLHNELRDYLTQSAPSSTFELIVVDWECSPDLSAVIDRFRQASPDSPAIRYVRCATPGRAALNNRAIALARGSLICFGADDFIPGPRYVETHLRFHTANPQPHRVGFGAGLSPDEQRARSPFLAWLEDTGQLGGVTFRQASPDYPSNYFTVANCSIKKAFLLSAGPFDERLPFPAVDDEEMGQRLTKLGLRSTFLRDADMGHDHLIFLPERCLQLTWAGYSKALLSASGLSPAEGRAHFEQVKRDIRRQWHQFIERDVTDWRGAWWKWRLDQAYLKGYDHFLRSPNNPEALNPGVFELAKAAIEKSVS